jgi:hypothetical protein
MAPRPAATAAWQSLLKCARVHVEVRVLWGLTLILLVAPLFLSAPAAQAHAFLDHSAPAVGSSTPKAPAVVRVWFSEQLEPAFSHLEVTDRSGKRVDTGDAKVDPADPTELRATLKPLPPGTYKVDWHVVSVDTHRTEGDFTFTVSP